MKFALRLLCAVALLLGWIPAQPAAAHAYLASSSPKQEAELSSPPQQVRATFTEGIEAGVSRLALFDAAGNEIAGQMKAEDDRTLTLTLDAELPAGVYRVEWQVLSVDTHVTEGSFRFAVGTKLAAERPQETVSLDDAPPAPAPPGGGSAPAETGRTPDAPPGDGRAEAGAAGTGGNGSGGGDAAAPAASGGDAGTRGEEAPGAAARPPSAEARPGAGDPVGGGAQAEADAGPDAANAEPPAADGGAAGAEAPDSASASEGTTDEAATDEDAATVGAITDGAPGPAAAEEATVVSPAPPAPPLADAAALHHHAHGGGGGLFSSHGLHVLLRVVDVLMLAALGGWLAFRALIAATPSAAPLHAAADAGWRRLAAAALALFLATGVGHAAMLSSELAGANMLAILGKTTVGWMAMGRVALCAMLFGLHVLRLPRRVSLGLSGLLFTLLALTFPLTGHAAAGGTLAATAHLLHIAAAVGWYGGLLGILYASGKLASGALLALVRSFSLAAVPLMIMIAASGLLLSGEQLYAVSELWTSGYGKLLLGKLVLFAAVLALGAYHHWGLLPKAEAGERRLIVGIRVEAAAAIALFTLAGWLATTPPPHMAATSAEDAAGQPFHWHVMGDIAHLSVDIPGLSLGAPTTITADVWVPEGDEPPDIVLITLVPPGSSGGSAYALAPTEDERESYAFEGYNKQHYAAPDEIEWTQRGTWGIQAVVVVPGKPALSYERTLEVR